MLLKLIKTQMFHVKMLIVSSRATAMEIMEKKYNEITKKMKKIIRKYLTQRKTGVEKQKILQSSNILIE